MLRRSEGRGWGHAVKGAKAGKVSNSSIEGRMHVAGWARECDGPHRSLKCNSEANGKPDAPALNIPYAKFRILFKLQSWGNE